MDIRTHLFENIKIKKSAKFLFPSLLIFISFFTSFDAIAQDDAAVQAGKKLFNANCAACHKLNKRAVGPALKGVSAKYDKEWLYSWIKNSTAMVKSGDAQAVAIYEEYNGSVMTSFPQLSNEDIDNIIAYTDYTPPAPVAAVAAAGANTQSASSGVSNNIILVALSLVFLILIVMLFLVQKTLLRIASASGVDIKPRNKNQKNTYLACFCSESIFSLYYCNSFVVKQCLFCIWVFYASRS